jgi:flagellar protein FliL
MASEAITAESGVTGAASATPTKKASSLGLVIEMAFLTCFAVGAGGLFGMLVLGGGMENAGAKPEPPAAHGKKQKGPEMASLRALPAIVTNLASPQKTWIRLEASIAFADATADSGELAAAVAEDVVAFLRTVPVGQLEGPSGLLHLREDLNDRARLRSGGKVRELVIQSLVLE